MPKTITVRMDEDKYEMTETAAEGERRSISKFIEYPTVNY